MVQFFAAFGLFFVVIQYLQFVVGRSPLQTAVALLPLPLVMIPLARTRRGSRAGSASGDWRRSAWPSPPPGSWSSPRSTGS